MKRAQRMNKTFLALSVNMLMIGGVYAADDVQTSTQEKSLEQSTQSSETAAQGSVFTDTSTPTAVASDQVNTAAVSSSMYCKVSILLYGELCKPCSMKLSWR